MTRADTDSAQSSYAWQGDNGKRRAKTNSRGNLEVTVELKAS